jgi:hypothetical protein
MVNLLEDAPADFFTEFYIAVCEFYGIDPDALFIHLMEEEIHE